jgi:hypothetical protein
MFIRKRSGFNYMFETIFVLLLLLLITIGMSNISYKESDFSLYNQIIINDVFISLSYLHTDDSLKIKEIIDLAFPNTYAEIAIESFLGIEEFAYSNNFPHNSKNCIIRKELIAVESETFELKDILKKFTIKACN